LGLIASSQQARSNALLHHVIRRRQRYHNVLVGCQPRYGLCWAGVLIGRRLVLILLYTFVNDALVRLLGMLLFCFVVLLHHVDVQPYRHRVGNIAGTFSATALVTLGTVNLVR